MSYPYPSENLTGFLDFIKYENDILEGFLGWGILITIFIILFMILKIYFYDTERSVLASSFITSIISILFFTAQIINLFPVIVFIAITTISTIYILWSD